MITLLKKVFERKKKQISSKLNSISKFYSDNAKIIKPYNKYKRMWDFFMIFPLLVDTFYTPLKAAFLENIETHYNIFNFSILTIIYFDILFNLHTAYYLKGDFIVNRVKIFKNYIKNNFIIDLLIFLPVISVDQNVNWLFLFRIIRLKQVLVKFYDFLQFDYYTQAFIDLGKLIMIIIYLAHICGCCFFQLAKFEIQYFSSENTWLHSKNLINSNWKSQYVNSIYFAVVTMITVGYGDISPQNDNEKVFAIFIMITSWIIFGFSLNRIGQILTEIMKEGKILKLKFIYIFSLLSYKKLNFFLI